MNHSQKKKRIDLLLFEKGLVPSRERAQGLILSGQVLVNDVPVVKPGQSVSESAVIRVRGEDHPYVSRGGVKLAAALDAFCISVGRRVALDIGASTGGFSDVLLARDIKKIFAVDVGRNQMDWKIRSDPRVIVKEKTNARYLTFDDISEKVGLIVVDVSFISLDKILPALTQFADHTTDWVTLVKPQFEVGRDKVGKGGIVTSEVDRNQALVKIIEFAKTIHLNRQSCIDSPITGADGNKEFLVHWKLKST
jgi:23S rRNA (cytidine1920-2'-O)/16S rRNA (cytidine1409-2'-O)-methyltransferase